MDSDLQELELPAFELDCREWLVASPLDGSIPDEIGGVPVVAMLSTAVIGVAEIEVATAILSVGLLDEPVDAVRLGETSPAAELLGSDSQGSSACYVVPAPRGRIALLAELTAGPSCDLELTRRFERLMTSFRWAA